MSVNMSFNANTVAPNTAPEPVPSGVYAVVIKESAEKPAKSTPGATFLELKMEIMEGDQKGKFIFDRLNTKNPNQQAVDIAYGTLSAICHVSGVMTFNNTAELHGKPFKVNVIKAPRADDATKDGNEIRGYLDMGGNPPGKQGAGAATGAADNAQAFGATTTAAPSTVTGAAPSAPSAPAAPTAPAAPAAPVDPAQAATADGWLAHPQNPAYMYKGADVKLIADVHALYAAPNANAAGSAGAPAVPETPASTAVPSWAS